MSRLRIDVDVKGKDIASEIERRIEDGIGDSVSTRRPDSLGRQMARAARQHIQAEGKVWTTELIRAFEITTEDQGDTTTLVLRNEAGHAAAIDTGATYGEEGPPLHRLIPWVKAKLQGYKVRDGALVKYEDSPGGGMLLTDGSGQPRGSSSGPLPDDEDIVQAENLRDTDITGGVNSGQAYWLTYENGEHAYFEEYKTPPPPTSGEPISQYGSTRNEILFRRLSAEAEWELAPDARGTEIIDPSTDSIVRGVAQRWIDDADPIEMEVPLPEHPADYDAVWDSPTEFVEENEDFLAKMTALDIIIGNNDRHGENLIVDADGNLHAIDNGGAYFAPDEALGALIRQNMVGTDIRNIMEFDEWPGLEAAYTSFLDQQLIYLEEFLENHREDIYRYAERIFDRDRNVMRRLDRLLGYETDEILDEVRNKQDDIVSADRIDIQTIDAILESEDITAIDDVKEELDDL